VVDVESGLRGEAKSKNERAWNWEKRGYMSREQIVRSTEQRAKRREQRVESREQRVESRE
jgi:hypothetical protein